MNRPVLESDFKSFKKEFKDLKGRMASLEKAVKSLARTILVKKKKAS